MADAIIAVSSETQRDVEKLFAVDPAKIHVIYNGIDPEEYRPAATCEALTHYGINPEVPYILFVGRITRQKGLAHLIRAIRFLDPGFQVVLCAGAPDTPEIAAEIKDAVATAQQERGGIIWIEEMLDDVSKIELYTHASVFVCPSIYEPFGIINLEAMACGTPVVASAVGGIPEVVAHGETGYLVGIEQMAASPFEPVHPEQFSQDLATRINELMANPGLREAFGTAGRARAREVFSWSSIATQTRDLYKSLV